MAELGGTRQYYNAFLCHSSSDKQRVRDLYWRLSRDAIECWFDEVSLLPGQDWNLEISRAIRRCRFVLVCLSHGSFDQAGYLQKELRRVLDVSDEQPDGSVYLIPVRLEPCDIPEKLARWQAVNVYDEIGYQRLVEAVRVVESNSKVRGSAGLLAIDDIIVEHQVDHIQLDVRIRNLGSQVLNLTRATVQVLSRSKPARAEAYSPSARYDLKIAGEFNEVAIGHRLGPGEVDGFYLRLGFTSHNMSCFFSANLSITYNGGMSVESTPFSFGSFF